MPPLVLPVLVVHRLLVQRLPGSSSLGITPAPGVHPRILLLGLQHGAESALLIELLVLFNPLFLPFLPQPVVPLLLIVLESGGLRLVDLLHLLLMDPVVLLQHALLHIVEYLHRRLAFVQFALFDFHHVLVHVLVEIIFVHRCLCSRLAWLLILDGVLLAVIRLLSLWLGSLRN